MNGLKCAIVLISGAVMDVTICAVIFSAVAVSIDAVVSSVDKLFVQFKTVPVVIPTVALDQACATMSNAVKLNVVSQADALLFLIGKVFVVGLLF